MSLNKYKSIYQFVNIIQYT